MPGAAPEKPALLARIHSALASLTGSEQKVAAVVGDDPRAVVHDSVTEPAAAAGVGETTVLRFARKLGYRSYPAFKIDLARDIFSEEPSAVLLKPGAPNGELLRHATEQNQRVVVDTYHVLDGAAFGRAVEMLASAREIHFFGVGHWGITAQDARYRLLRLGSRAEAHADPHFQFTSAAMLTPEDVAVGLSVSGSTHDTIGCLLAARQQGANRSCW